MVLFLKTLLCTQQSVDIPFSAGGGGNLLGDVSHMTVVELEEWGVGLNVGIAWEDALHSALMPITPQASMGSLADGKGCGCGCG